MEETMDHPDSGKESSIDQKVRPVPSAPTPRLVATGTGGGGGRSYPDDPGRIQEFED